MKKVRVYQVARDFDVSSEAMLELLRGMGLELKSHMSSITAEQVEQVRAHFEKEKATVKEEYARQRKRLRARQEPSAEAPTAPPAKGPQKTAPRTPAAKDRRPRSRGRGARRRPVVDEKAVKESVRRTLAQLEGRRPRRRRRRGEDGGGLATEVDRMRVPEFLSTAELARTLDVSPNEVIRKCVELGAMVTMNQRLDRDLIQSVADEFGLEVDIIDELSDEMVVESVEDRAEDLQERPPVVTVMGHVDHGKTSLLDYIRRTNVIAGEAGGITQHIGAYEVKTSQGQVTFLDTPGHEAFSAMRARGAQVTDVVVLVVAADEGVRPQTVEAIDHATAAGVPIVVAVNKMDLPGANPDRVKQELGAHGITVEDWGGKTVTVNCSAKTGDGIDRLLEMILLEAEMRELKANPNKSARGVVVEAELDRGRGVVATVIIQEGTLRVGDAIVIGLHGGKVRALLDERGNQVDKAGPSNPVRVLGLDGVPQAGDTLLAVGDEREARNISSKRIQMQREHDFRYTKRVTLDDLHERITKGELRELNLIVKGDVDGSVGALCDSLLKLPGEDEVQAKVIHRGVGPVNLSDVLLAAAADAIIIAFHVLTEPQARERARQEGVDIRSYRVIYEAVENVSAALKGLIRPRYEEKVLGQVEVRTIFRISHIGVIAGSMVRSGTVTRNARGRLTREGQVIHEGRITSLKRFKDDVREVTAGYECGIGIEGCDDIQENDTIEVYELVEVKP